MNKVIKLCNKNNIIYDNTLCGYATGIRYILFSF